MMRLVAAITALCCIPVVAGCGAVDDVKKSVTDTVRGEVASQCRDQAKSIEDPETRRTTLEACDAVKSGDTDQVRRRLERECLKQTRDISESSSRKQAQEQCRKIGPDGK